MNRPSFCVTTCDLSNQKISAVWMVEAMPLSANARLGPYEIRSTLGAGGMGEVYQAFDTRLNRNVAIKVLRADHAITPELRARFEREARAIAAFNHPNIVSVYDFVVDADQQYIVSELVEGSSLRSLLAGKPLPLRKLLDIATQVADGLAAAHAAGFVHRDLKPENIMLTKDGRVKIVDFGLARQDAQSVSDSGSTLTYMPDGADSSSDTKAGVVLGTPRYMSPEQAVGKPADYRSDQFSFGLILYELASGKQAFAKDSSVETMAAIVREEPSPLDEKLPAPLRWIIDRCLQKEPEQRYESTRDLYQELRNLRDHLSEAHSSSALAPVAPPVKPRRWKIPALCAVCAVLAALLVYLLKPSGQNIGNYSYTPFASDAAGAVWSPDGKSIAYTGLVNGSAQVFVRSLNSPVAIQLTHEKNGAELVGWSSDPSHVVVLSYDPDVDPAEVPAKLSSVATFGGELQHIMDVECFGCALSTDGKAFATLRRGKDQSYGVWISDPFGTPLRQYLPTPFASKQTYGQPQLVFSPNGRKLLLSLSGDLDHPEVWVLPYPTGSGTPRQVLHDVTFSTSPGVSWFPDNRHIVISRMAGISLHEHLWVADAESGKLEPLTNGTHREREPTLSPDGRTLLYDEYVRRFDIASVTVADGSVSTLDVAGHREHKPAWAARQAKLIWVSDRSGSPEIWMRNLDGSDRPVVTTQDFPAGTATAFLNPALSPEGDRLVYGMIDNAGVIQLWVASLAGGSPARLTNSPPAIAEYASNWSPDGKEYVYLQASGGKANLTKVETSGNATPVVLRQDVDWSFLPDWSPTGEWITFEDNDGAGLVSPDGKNLKRLGKLQAPYLTFSKDGKKLYGINMDKDHVELFSLDPTTLKMKVIKDLGKEWAPRDDLLPGVRFSMAPDGKSFVYAVSKTESDLWMLTGYRQSGWRARISDALGLK